MSDLFGKVNGVLSNPAVKTGLRLAGPQASLIAEGVQALMLTFASAKPTHKEADVLDLIDTRAAELIQELAETKSRSRRSELEIRLHELLEIGQRWDRVT